MTREGRNTIGYRSADGTIFGGPIKDSDSVYQNEQNEIVVSYRHSVRHWSIDEEYIFRFILFFDSTESNYALKDVWYAENYDNARLDLSESNEFSLSYHDPSKNIICGNFDLYFVLVDTFFVGDTLNTIHHFDTIYSNHLYDGRFDIHYPN